MIHNKWSESIDFIRKQSLDSWCFNVDHQIAVFTGETQMIFIAHLWIRIFNWKKLFLKLKIF